MLNEFLARIESLHPKTIDLGLERVRSVVDKFIPLSFDCPLVLVGGTNGKGSTVAVLSALAQANGLRVGVYTSPHLYQFNERIKINEAMIADEDLLSSLQAVEQARGETSLTYFEYTTLAALHYFHRSSLDLVILEVGMGGRLDATNIVGPDLSIITSIGLDHTAYLGNTKEAIALEKAGIMRAGKPLVCGEIALQGLLRDRARDTGAVFYGLGHEFVCADGVKSTLVPSNIACAVKAAQLLEIPVSIPVIETVAVLGRKQHKLMQGKQVLLDVAHNEDSLRELVNYLRGLPYSGVHLVMGVMGDKELGSALNELARLCKTIHLAAPNTSRAMPAQALSELIAVSSTPHASVADAFTAALRGCDKDELVVVTGSFYTVGEISIL